MNDQYRDQSKIMTLLESLVHDNIGGIDIEGIVIETGIEPEFVCDELDALMDEGRVIKFYDDESQHSYYRLAGEQG